jgi:hypothetical protein
MPHPTAADTPASQSPALDYCDPEITGAVEEAFNEVWDVIKANDQPGSEAETDCERRVELSRRLAELVVAGITDPAELRKRALASLGLADLPSNIRSKSAG